MKAERQDSIVELLKTHEIMTVSDLSQRFETSVMTIRRDLDYLDSIGVVKKVHGGAVLLKSEQPSFNERIISGLDIKQKIGQKAAEFINEGSVVFFDAGTTPLCVVEAIPEKLEFTAITTGLMTGVSLCSKPRVNVVVVGGSIHHTSYSAMDYNSANQIKEFRADLAFISTSAIAPGTGTYEVVLPLIEVKRAIVSVSKKVVLLADHTKFSSQALRLSIPISDIHVVITDSQIPEKHLEDLKRAVKEVYVV